MTEGGIVKGVSVGRDTAASGGDGVEADGSGGVGGAGVVVRAGGGLVKAAA
ncbi:hypothetical protein GCM10010486_32730 [Nonomuraea roseoviolacea subsp. carminata]